MHNQTNKFYGDMADVAEYCGEDVASHLVEYLPQISLKLPKTYRKGCHKFLDRLEENIAQKLVEHFGGEQIYVTIYPPQESQRKHVFEMRNEGFSIAEIAVQLNISQIRVSQIIRDLKDGKPIDGKAGRPAIGYDKRQLDLFLPFEDVG